MSPFSIFLAAELKSHLNSGTEVPLLTAFRQNNVGKSPRGRWADIISAAGPDVGIGDSVEVYPPPPTPRASTKRNEGMSFSLLTSPLACLPGATRAVSLSVPSTSHLTAATSPRVPFSETSGRLQRLKFPNGYEFDFWRQARERSGVGVSVVFGGAQRSGAPAPLPSHCLTALSVLSAFPPRLTLGAFIIKAHGSDAR